MHSRGFFEHCESYSSTIPSNVDCLNDKAFHLTILDVYYKLHFIFAQIFNGFLHSIPVTILALTIERYMMVSQNKLSQKFLERRNRILFYTVVTICALMMPMARIADYIFAEKTVRTLHDALNWVINKI